MLSGIYAGAYQNPYLYRAQNASINRTAQAQQTGAVWTARRVAQPDVPVQPVKPVTPVDPKSSFSQLGLPIRQGADPVEMAVRMRIQYPQDDAAQALAGEAVQGAEDSAAQGVEGVMQAAEEGKCETCEKRKYQDESDDMSVSFQSPTNIAPEQVASAVRGHEMEHVSHEQAKAKQNDRKVVSQSVTLHTDICPECGKVYISGGTTRTVTKSMPDTAQDAAQQQQQTRTPFSAVA